MNKHSRLKDLKPWQQILIELVIEYAIIISAFFIHPRVPITEDSPIFAKLLWIISLIGVLFLVFIALSRTVKWTCVLYDVKFSKPETVYTKGFRNYGREPLMPILSGSRYSKNRYNRTGYYTTVRFDDQKFKGWYTYFDFAYDFKHGQCIEVVYYPISKHIVSMRTVEEEKTKKRYQYEE